MASRKTKPEATAAQAPDAGAQSPDVTGDGGERDDRVSGAIQELESLGEAFALSEVAENVVAESADFMLEQFKHRPRDWGKLSQSEQRDLQRACLTNAKALVARVAEIIMANGKEPVRAMLVSYTEKDGIQTTLKLKPASIEEEEAGVLFLHRAKGKIVLITVASADDYHGSDTVQDRSQPDQPEMGFEAGTDEHPADSSDLAAAGLPSFFKTGERTVIDDSKIEHEIRIHLEQGMVQGRPIGDYQDAEDGWIDVREANSTELAYERDRRMDDFEEPEPVQEALPVE